MSIALDVRCVREGRIEFGEYAPEATTGPEVEDAATLPAVLRDEDLGHWANVVFSAKEELQHAVLELGALEGIRRAVGGWRVPGGLTRISSSSAGSMYR